MNMSSHPMELGDDPQTALQEILGQSCRQLFSAYGIDTAAGSSPDSAAPVLGRIHFVGKDMSGTLTIGLDREQLKRSLPVASDRQADLEDWVRELANQLMGLVKTRLQEHGVHVILSLPITVKASMPPDGPKWPSRISQFNVSCNFAQALTSLDGVLIAEVKLKAPD
jgi:chemotaxis phosphatase CheX-like protein